MTLNEWIIFGEVGASSKTIWGVVTGALNRESSKRYRPCIPYDRDDFGRCYKLYVECNLKEADLQKVKEVFPVWTPFIDNWSKLASMYETGENMYEYIKTLVRQSYDNFE